MDYPKKIQALKDNPHSGNVRKGEIGIWTGISNNYDFPSQKGYSVGTVPKSLYKVLEITNINHYEIY